MLLAWLAWVPGDQDLEAVVADWELADWELMAGPVDPVVMAPSIWVPGVKDFYG